MKSRKVFGDRRVSKRRRGRDLAGSLETLLEESQQSADRLAALLAESERAAARIAVSGARLESPAPQPGPDETLKKQLGELTSHAEQLETARAVAEAADQAKSCFLAAVSRELRTPVDGLARMLELLQQTDLDEDQRRYLATANYSVCSLLSLLDSVLGASKLDAGVRELRRTDFDLRRTIDQAIEVLRPVVRRRGLQITSGLDPNLPSLVRGEPGRLRQVILYTIRRALQFAAQGEIAVAVTVKEATDTTTTIRFAVGHGDTLISAEQFSRAFAPRAHLDAKPFGGCGMGLAIARQIVELMGGRMRADHEDRRLTISFDLPLENFRKTSDDRREHGRLPQELLTCNLGTVVDLSMGGMRVRCTRVPKGEVAVELQDHEAPVSLRGTVMWARRLGFRRYEVGLSFPRVPPDVAKELTRVSLNHRLRRLLGMM